MQPEKTAALATAGHAVAGTVERLPRRETIVVESGIPMLDTGMFEHMQRIATTMASSNLVPEHLNKVQKVAGQVIELSPKEAIANCFLVTNQAIRWRMDPFAVAQHTFVTKGKVGYEGKLIAAVINTHPAIEERLTYEYSGAGKERKVVVKAKLKGDAQSRTVEGTVASWETTHSGSPWSNTRQHDQQLSYRGAREWARRWLPEAILGVYGDDEIAQFDATERTLTSEQPEPQRGAAGLKAALATGPVEDATVLPPEAKDKTPAQPQQESAAGAGAGAGADKPAAVEKAADKKGGRPGGTLELQTKYLDRFKESKDSEILDILMDEARNAYEWTPADLQTIEAAYKARQKDLAGS